MHRNYTQTRCKQLSKIIWQKAASPSCHPWQEHSPAAAGNQRAMHSCVSTLPLAGTSPQKCPFPWGDRDSIYYMVPWTHTNQSPKRHLDRHRRFFTAHPCTQHKDRQTHRPHYVRHRHACDSIHNISIQLQINNYINV